MMEARLSIRAKRLLYDMDWYTEDSGTPSACGREGGVSINHVIQDRGESGTDLGHDNVLAPETVIRVRLVEIYVRDGDRSVRADVLHSRHLRFGLASWHEPTSNTRNDDTAIA